jgi:hypothetical protein
MKISAAAIAEAISVLNEMGTLADSHVRGHGSPPKDLAASAKRCFRAAESLKEELAEIPLEVE